MTCEFHRAIPGTRPTLDVEALRRQVDQQIRIYERFLAFKLPKSFYNGRSAKGRARRS